MRLGACALVIAVSAALAPTPAQAQPDSPVEVVTASITEIKGYVDTARQVELRAERQAIRESLQRDNAALRALRVRLRAGEVTGTSARKTARRTASCAGGKLGYATRIPARIRNGMAEITEGGQAALDAYDPEGENADRIEDLVAEAYEHRDLMAGRIAPAVAAAVRVRCHRPDATLEQALVEHDAAMSAFEDAYRAIAEATRLVEEQFEN